MTGKEETAVTDKRPAFWHSQIGRRLLLAILAFSSLITLAVTASDLYLEYRAGVLTISDRLRQVEISYAASLGESLWNLDKRQIALQLRGIVELPDIRYVELRESNSASPIRFSVSLDDRNQSTDETRDIPVWCNCGGSLRSIGVLHVEATHANLYRDIFRRTQVILAGQAVKTFLVATFILFVVHRMVTRHLLNLASAMAGFTPGTAAKLPLRRDHRRKPDEFDELVETIAAMGERLERRSADLRAADARMQAILDNIPDLAWFKDSDGRFIAGNRSLAALLGLDGPGMLVGKCDLDFSPPDLAERYRADDRQVIDTRRTLRIEEWHVRPDGSRFLIETVKTPLYDGAGAVIGTVGIARDISDRRTMEERLRETATRLKALIANLKATVFRSTYSIHGPRLSVSFYGTEEGAADPAVEISPVNLEQFRRSFHPGDRAREFDAIGKEFDQCGYVNRPCRLFRADGQIRWFMVRERVVGRDGDVITTEGLSVDVSDEIETRRMLEALIANMPGAVFRLHYDANGNKHALFLRGGQARQRTVLPSEDYHPDDRRSLFVEVPERLRNSDLVVHTFRRRNADGSYTWVRAWERLVERIGDEMITEGISLDVNDEMLAKEAYEASQTRFREFVHALPVGAFEDEVGKGCVYASGLWIELTGLPIDDILGHGWLRAVHPDDLERVLATWKRDTTARAIYHSEYRLVHVTGRVTWVLCRAVPRLNPDGSLRGYIGSIFDISDRKRMEEALRASEEGFRTLAENLPGTVFRMRYPAHGLKKLLMIDGAQLRGMRAIADAMVAMPAEEFAELYHPDDRAELYEELPRRLREHGAAEYTQRVRGPDGGWRWARTWERVVERQGEEIVTEGITLDVTEEIEAKRQLEKSERHFGDLVEALPVGVFEIDAAQGCVFASSLWSRLTGLTAADLLGDGWWRSVCADDQPRVEALWQQCMADRSFFQAEYRLHHVDSGSDTWVLARALPRLDDDGRLLGYIGSITDISHRKVYEGSLERLNHVLRTVTAGNEVLMQAPDKMALFTAICRVLVGVGGYHMAWVGLAEHDDARRVRPVAWAGADDGYMSSIDVRWDESVQGSGPSGTAIRTDLPQIVNDIAADLRMWPWQGEALPRGFRSSIALPLKAEGSVIGCLNIYSTEVECFSEEEGRILLDFANNIAFTVVALRERRRREEVERHLQQAQKMEALGLLAGSVAHDFNNLLGAIQGFAGFIVEDSPEGDSASYYGQRILMAGKRGKALIGQILSFSRQMDMKREVFAVADLMAETNALLEATLPATTQMVIHADVGGAVVTGDRDLLGQALINLCLNANDALGGAPGIVSIIAHTCPSGEEIATRLPAQSATRLSAQSASEATVWEDADGLVRAVTGSIATTRPCLSVAVTDSGCGMDRTVMEKIFTPFFTTKNKEHGTGLGLAAVHRTVLAHQGLILVESRPGHGATFEIVLPCEGGLNALPAPDGPSHCAPAAQGTRILLVDDDTDFGDMLLTALERRGYDVSPCSDPLEALEGLTDFPGAWDAMVTDQTMPNMSGLELIRAAKALQPTLNCILCTGYAEDALDEATLTDAGALALLRKPVDIDELVGKLNQAAAR